MVVCIGFIYSLTARKRRYRWLVYRAIDSLLERLLLLELLIRCRRCIHSN